MMRFSKMHGAGNDFVVLDLRDGQQPPTAALCQQLADRHMGVGCDQVLTIEPASTADSVARYRIWNADGSVSGQCGNGARCIAAWLVREGVAPADRDFLLESPAGLHAVQQDAHGGFCIDMGAANFTPSSIPLLAETTQPRYTTQGSTHSLQFGAVSMGNPHAVLEVDDCATADVTTLGPLLQGCGLFPESANIGFAQVLSPTAIRLRVFERGAGETLACGSGACAAVAILTRWGKLRENSPIEVHLPGGTLYIRYDNITGHLVMCGPATFVFEGVLP